MSQETASPSSIPERVEVAVVGAGVAGLTAARHLVKAGKDVHLFDPNPDPGGRVRTVYKDGFQLDQGFQVLLTGYPAVQEELDLEALDLHKFEPGAIVVRDGVHYDLPDPFRTPKRWLAALRYPLATFSDKFRTRRIRKQIQGQTMEELFSAPAVMAADWLRSQGFSERFLATFWTPFFSAVFLDPPLEVSSRIFQFVFRCIAVGDIALPAKGIGEIARQIARDLPEDRYHPETRVLGLHMKDGKVTGLQVGAEPLAKQTARKVEADTVILACGVEEARELSGLDLPLLEPLGVSVVYFTTEKAVTDERRIFLNGGGSSPGHHVAFLSNICPHYAPPGAHLIEVTILGTPESSGEVLAERVRRQIAVWFPEGGVHNWRWLETFKVPMAQFRQPPGLLPRLPGPDTEIEGLLLAGDYTRHSSLQGAMHSGQVAAKWLLEGKK